MSQITDLISRIRKDNSSATIKPEEQAEIKRLEKGCQTGRPCEVITLGEIKLLLETLNKALQGRNKIAPDDDQASKQLMGEVGANKILVTSQARDYMDKCFKPVRAPLPNP